MTGCNEAAPRPKPGQQRLQRRRHGLRPGDRQSRSLAERCPLLPTFGEDSVTKSFCAVIQHNPFVVIAARMCQLRGIWRFRRLTISRGQAGFRNQIWRIIITQCFIIFHIFVFRELFVARLWPNLGKLARFGLKPARRKRAGFGHIRSQVECAEGESPPISTRGTRKPAARTAAHPVRFSAARHAASAADAAGRA